MTNYRVTFFKQEREEQLVSGKKKMVVTKSTILGTIIIDDYGTENMTLISKAFRHVGPGCGTADYVQVTKL